MDALDLGLLAGCKEQFLSAFFTISHTTRVGMTASAAESFH